MKNKQRIKLEFERMLESSRMEDISVSQLMARCGLPRTVFYRYFKDKFDLVSEIYLDDIIARINLSVDRNWRHSILICYRHIDERRGFFRRAVKYKGQNNFLEALFTYSAAALTASLQAALGVEELEERMALSVQMYCRACTHLVEWWLSAERGVSPEELYQIALDNIPLCLEKQLEQMELVLWTEA